MTKLRTEIEGSTRAASSNEPVDVLVIALNGLLVNMHKDPQVLTTSGIFRIPSDVKVLDATMEQIKSGQAIDYTKLTPHFKANLVKRLLRALQSSGVVFISEHTLIPDDFSPDSEIKTMINSLFGLLKKISDASNVHQMNAANLGKMFAAVLFREKNDITYEEAKDLLKSQSEKVKQLIEGMPALSESEDSNLTLSDDPQPASQAYNSSTVKMYERMTNKPGPALHNIIVEGPGSKNEPRSFIRRNLSKITISPSVAVFAGLLTAALLIAFPPAGIALGLLLGVAVPVATVVGLAIGYAVGAIIDYARKKEYRKEQIYNYEPSITDGGIYSDDKPDLDSESDFSGGPGSGFNDSFEHGNNAKRSSHVIINPPFTGRGSGAPVNNKDKSSSDDQSDPNKQAPNSDSEENGVPFTDSPPR